MKKILPLLKRTIIYFISIILFFSSCKKDHSVVKSPPLKTYEVNFKVSGISQATGISSNNLQSNSLKTNASVPIAGYIDILYYSVYDANGNQINVLKQDSTFANFGNITDNLPAGTYTFVISAGKPGLSTTIFDNDGLPKTLTRAYISYTNGIWKDAFFDKFVLTVSGNVSHAITLNRVVGKLEVDIEDVLPAAANSISVVMNPEDAVYSYSTGQPLATQTTQVTTTTVIPVAAKGTANYKVYNYVGNTLTPFTATITCYDAANNILGTAVVPGVTCQQNERTILSGRLFGSNTAFNISLNSAWNTPVVVPYSVK